MHAFDLRTLDGRQINVRRAKEGEKIVTLDGNSFDLSPANLVICDGVKPVALAGIMGGLNSEIKDDTSEVLFEAAKFARDSVRKTARALGQHSDSSAIFEKGVNEYTTEMAMKRALHLIEELGCGTVTTLHADVTTPYSKTENKKMSVSVQKINALLGVEVPAGDMVRILKSLQFGVELNGDELALTVPRWREDIDLYPDIAEEIIRFYGYEHVKGTFLPSALITNGGYNKTQKAELQLKKNLSAAGLCEISTYSFYSERDLDALHIPADSELRKAIKILNPISEELSVMRTFLAPSLLQVAVRNLRRGNLEGKVYELAKTYIAKQLPATDFPEEKPVLALCMWGKYDFFDLKGITEFIARDLNTRFEYRPAERVYLHPGICGEILADGEVVGYLGALSPKIGAELALDRSVLLAEIDYDKLTEHARQFKYSPISKFAEEKRDLALLCDKDVSCGEIEKEIFAACKFVTEVRLFDVYEGEQIKDGKKSMAFTVTFTPKDEDISERVDGFVKKILSNLRYKLNVELR